MKVKYKVTGPFGMSPDGEMRDAWILNIDEDTGVALCYHPPDKDGCGSFEFVRQKKKYWVSVDTNIFSNLGKVSPHFNKFLKQLK